MSQAKTRRTSWVGWIISAILVVGSVALWTQRQNVVDAIQYYQYDPTPLVKSVATDAGLTDDAIFTFYATHPSIESSEMFNQHCKRQEADSPILGCFTMNRIFIFDVSDERLKGIKVVTAAHELLHAEYERLPDTEKRRLQSLLEKAYASVNDEKLDARMKYYEKTEPGQSINELHSIVGTEFETISPELEAYYARFFKDRAALVKLQKQVESTFESLSREADQLVEQLETLASKINSDTSQYNNDTESLNQKVQEFNDRAGRSGGFTTQSEFQSARQQLIIQSNALSESRQKIQLNITQYKTLLAKLESINSESASLNASLDSVLQDAPKI
ncbi:hypothetical protein H7142_02515 [Candidatus Saccharibacteria bacterium]|nr:hypothetical protein [Candidatus Saccharibacteria bacterium]